MQLFDIKVFGNDREYDVTLRNLSIIRVSAFAQRIGVACRSLLWSVKRLVIPGGLVIEPLIKFRFIKSLRERADIFVSVSTLARSLKQAKANDSAQISADSNITSMKKIVGGNAWHVIAEALFGTKKALNSNAALSIDADICFEKVRKRRLGELCLVRLADMEMTFDELDYVLEE